MTFPSLAAAAAVSLDAGVGLMIATLVGSLGAAGAAVTATHYFIGFLKNQEIGRARIATEFRNYHAESQKMFQDQLERLAAFQNDNEREFQTQVTRITESQNTVLRDTIVTLKGIENSLEESTATMEGMQEGFGSPRLGVCSIDVHLCNLTDKDMAAEMVDDTVERKP